MLLIDIRLHEKLVAELGDLELSAIVRCLCNMYQLLTYNNKKVPPHLPYLPTTVLVSQILSAFCAGYYVSE
jgi:hypothetical protein